MVKWLNYFIRWIFWSTWFYTWEFGLYRVLVEILGVYEFYWWFGWNRNLSRKSHWINNKCFKHDQLFLWTTKFRYIRSRNWWIIYRKFWYFLGRPSRYILNWHKSFGFSPRIRLRLRRFLRYYHYSIWLMAL